ncbi:MAG: hypothetical protein AB7W47_16030 [Calditrichaceae bacterium]
MSMITIISALKEEIRPLLETLTVKQKLKTGSGTLYVTDEYHFLRTGVGLRHAEDVLNSYLSSYEPSEIINIGTAGSLKHDHRSGDIFYIGKIYYKTRGQFIDLPSELNKTEKAPAVLLTVDQPVMNKSDREASRKRFNAGLVDMEAYALAKICFKNNIKFTSYKIVSDLADENTEGEFMANYKVLSKKLAEYILKILRI